MSETLANSVHGSSSSSRSFSHFYFFLKHDAFMTTVSPRSDIRLEILRKTAENEQKD